MTSQAELYIYLALAVLECATHVPPASGSLLLSDPGEEEEGGVGGDGPANAQRASKGDFRLVLRNENIFNRETPIDYPEVLVTGCIRPFRDLLLHDLKPCKNIDSLIWK